MTNPGKKQEIQHLINKEFGVQFHPVYLSEFLADLGLSRAIPRIKRPSRPDNAEEILEERVDDAFDEDEDDEPHNKQDGEEDEGWVVDEISVRMVGLLSAFSTHLIHSRGITHSGSTTLMIHNGINLVFLPVGSPDLNPIEPVWKSLRWEASPMIVESAEEIRALVTDLFERLTKRVSFASPWIENFLAPHLQKLS